MVARYAQVMVAALVIGFAGGLLVERHHPRGNSTAQAAAPLATAVIQAQTTAPPVTVSGQHSLMAGGDFEKWLRVRGAQRYEPILDPDDLDAVIYPCGEALSPCSRQREVFQQTIDSLRRYPKQIRDVALCMTTGCDGAVAKLPANACLWWSYYVTKFEADRGGVDTRHQQTTCTEAEFGSADRTRALAGLWEQRIIKLLTPQN